MKSFLVFKVISTWIFIYFQKGFPMKLLQNTQFMTAILFCFISTALHGEYNVIVRDSYKPIKMLELPRSLSVYILIAPIGSNVKGRKNLSTMLFSLYTITHSLSTSISIGSYPFISWFTVVGFYQLNTNWAMAGFHCHSIDMVQNLGSERI